MEISDASPDGADASPDATPDASRRSPLALQELPLADAAARLGLSPDAVRLRVQRGKTLRGSQRDGRWFVWLDDADLDGARRDGDASPAAPDASPTEPDASVRLAVAEARCAALTAERDRLVTELERMHARLAAEQERVREAHLLLAQRPALPAPVEDSGKDAETYQSRPRWWARWAWWRR